MNKLLATFMLGVSLAAGAASAQTTTTVQVRPSYVTQPGAYGAAGRYRLASLRSQHAFGIGTTGALSRNVGPGSTSAGFSDSILNSPNSGMPLVPGAPDAGNPSGGN